MKNLFLVFGILLTINMFGQSFDEKPYSFVEKLVLNNVKSSEVKLNLPTGYSIAMEDSEKVVAEKTINGKIYDIQFFYENNVLTGIMFTIHSSKVWKVLNEMSDLDYKVSNNTVFNNIETTIYSKESQKLGGLMICNDNTRILTGSINKVK